MFDGEKKQTLLTNLTNFLYSLVPNNAKQKVIDIPNTAAVKGVSQQFKGLLDQIINLPVKLINDLKIQVATTIYQSIISQ